LQHAARAVLIRILSILGSDAFAQQVSSPVVARLLAASLLAARLLAAKLQAARLLAVRLQG
jgi:hypothetical protein